MGLYLRSVRIRSVRNVVLRLATRRWGGEINDRTGRPFWGGGEGKMGV